MACTDPRLPELLPSSRRIFVYARSGKRSTAERGPPTPTLPICFGSLPGPLRKRTLRALLLHALGGQPLLLKSLKSDDVETTDKVEAQATLTNTGRQNLLLEQIVSRLSLEPGASGVSCEIVAEHD